MFRSKLFIKFVLKKRNNISKYNEVITFLRNMKISFKNFFIHSVSDVDGISKEQSKALYRRYKIEFVLKYTLFLVTIVLIFLSIYWYTKNRTIIPTEGIIGSNDSTQFTNVDGSKNGTNADAIKKEPLKDSNKKESRTDNKVDKTIPSKQPLKAPKPKPEKIHDGKLENVKSQKLKKKESKTNKSNKNLNDDNSNTTTSIENIK